MREIKGNYTVPKKQIAIVATTFNDLVVENLIRGAKEVLACHNIPQDQIECIYVPGAFEIPFACQKIGESGRFAGIITLGAIIRGQTPHFDYVASNCTSGILQASLKTNIPITFGVLTTETLEQALHRAGTKSGNKGKETALALLELMNVVAQINE